MGGRAVAYRRLALRSTLASPEVVLPVGHIDTHSTRWSLVEHGGNPSTVVRAVARVYTVRSPAPNWRSNYRCAALVQSQTTFLALVSCPLSLWERVRVRVFIRTPWGPSPPALSRWGEGARGVSCYAQRGYLMIR